MVKSNSTKLYYNLINSSYNPIYINKKNMTTPKSHNGRNNVHMITTKYIKFKTV